MKDLHKLDNYDINFINSLIINEIEESIHIDFKASGALTKAEAKRKEVSKDVAAFANSDGGIIIYGISEQNHKAFETSFIDGNIYTKEWLEQIINSTVNRNIEGLKIFPIRYNGNICETIYVVQIPVSLNTPHQSRDKRFYKRYNFESVPMEEYEIRQLYGRKLKSELIIDKYSIRIQELQKFKTKFLFETNILNTGEIPEKDYKVNVYFDNIAEGIDFFWDIKGSGTNYEYTIFNQGKTVKLSNSNLPTIYPNETVNALRFNFVIDNDKIDTLLENLEFRILVFYSNGEDIMIEKFMDIKQKILDRIISLRTNE